MSIAVLTAEDLIAPPPPDIECDCEPVCDCTDLNACQHPPVHWHQRFMRACCDVCDLIEIEADVFVYTRIDAFRAIAEIARGKGWRVTASGWYVCPGCRSDA